MPLPGFGAVAYPGTPLIGYSFVTDATGHARQVVHIDEISASACGATVVFQALVEDATAQGGFAFSAGLRLEVGSLTGRLFGPASAFALGTSPIEVALGDFDGDDVLDLAASDRVSDHVSLLFGSGDGTLGVQASAAVGQETFGLAVADLNQDANLDLVVNTEFPYLVGVLEGAGGGSFATPLTYPIDATGTWGSVVIADFDEDGVLDVASMSRFGGTVWYYPGNGDGSLAPGSSLDFGPNPWGGAAGDLNGDGHVDLVVANDLVSTVTIRFGNGKGSFSSPTVLPAGTNPVGVALADFNQDGRLDLAVANGSLPVGSVTILLGTGGGSFAPPATYVSGGPGTVSILTQDFDGDGSLDLAAANSVGNSVSIFSGVGDGTFSLRTSLPSGGFTQSIAAGDLDGDYDVDLVVVSQEPFALVYLNRLIP